MDRYLMINADDFGSFQCANAAIMELLKNPESPLTSSTVMAPAPWAAQACRFAAANPELAVGVHLTLTSEWSAPRWAPVSQGDTSSLRDEEGYMWRSSADVERHADAEQVACEIEAQIARCRALGMVSPSHIDNHMGSLYGVATGRWELLSITLGAVAALGLPFRLPSDIAGVDFGNTMLGVGTGAEETAAAAGQMVEFCANSGVALPDHLIPNEWGGPQERSYEDFREYLYDLYANIPCGVTETYLHPAYGCDELKAATGVWYRRDWERRVMSDPMTKRHIEAHGIRLIDYRELAKMRRSGPTKFTLTST